VSYHDTYFVSKATAMIAFVPIMEIVAFDKDYKVFVETITGIPHVCRIGGRGPGRLKDKYDKKKIDSFLQYGKLIRVENSFNYPDYPAIESND